MTGISNLRDTIIPKSDQINAEDVIGAPPTITVERVSRSKSPDQPVDVFFNDKTGKAYRPCKTMRKVLIFAWGEDGALWVGRSMTLFCDPDVKWGGVKVGGVRVSHLSHIDRDIAMMLAETKGKKTQVNIKRLTAKQAPVTTTSAPAVDSDGMRAALAAAAAHGTAELRAAWGSLDAETRAAIDPAGCPFDLKQIALAADKAKG